MSYRGGLSEKLPEASFMAHASWLLLRQTHCCSKTILSVMVAAPSREKIKNEVKELQPVAVDYVEEVCEGLSLMYQDHVLEQGESVNLLSKGWQKPVMNSPHSPAEYVARDRVK